MSERLMGRPVHVSSHLTKPDDEHVRASFVRPLWRRLLAGRTSDPVPVTVQVPDDQVYGLPDGSFVVHPATWDVLKDRLSMRAFQNTADMLASRVVVEGLSE